MHNITIRVNISTCRRDTATDVRAYFVGTLRQRLGPHHEHLEVHDERRRTEEHGVALYELHSRSADAQCRGDCRPLGTELTSNITQDSLSDRLVGRHVVDGHLAQRLRRQQVWILTTYANHSLTTTLCLKKGPTCKLSVTLSNLNRFSKFLHY